MAMAHAHANAAPRRAAPDEPPHQTPTGVGVAARRCMPSRDDQRRTVPPSPQRNGAREGRESPRPALGRRQRDRDGAVRVLSVWRARVRVRVRARPKQDGFPLFHETFNRGKRSVTVDLKNAASRELVHALVRWCDVLAENFKTGTLARRPARCLAGAATSGPPPPVGRRPGVACTC